jgi:hypothetical protein
MKNTITLYLSEIDKAIFKAFKTHAKNNGKSTSKALIDLIKKEMETNK